jgi:phospholipid transport system substrate-binding protein
MKVLFALLLFVFSAQVHAQQVFDESVSAESPEASEKQKIQAAQFIEGLGQRTIAILENENTDPAEKEAQLRALFEEYVALEWVGRFVLGRHWRQANQEQRQAYLKYYKDFIINSYTDRLKQYTGQNFTITRTIPLEDEKYLLTMQILRPGEANVIVDYRLRKNGESFHIYDIVVEGVSLITTQRSEFDSVVSNRGLDYLIAQLRKRSSSEAS